MTGIDANERLLGNDTVAATTVVPPEADVGSTSAVRPIEASKVAVRYVCNTSIPAGRNAQIAALFAIERPSAAQRRALWPVESRASFVTLWSGSDAVSDVADCHPKKPNRRADPAQRRRFFEPRAVRQRRCRFGIFRRGF